MKTLFTKHFEKTWLCIFLFMFILIMLPLPFFFSETYIPSIGKIPSFIIGWLIHAAITFGLIIIYYKMCMKRNEYHEYD